jgi:hypothetical protein
VSSLPTDRQAGGPGQVVPEMQDFLSFLGTQQGPPSMSPHPSSKRGYVDVPRELSLRNKIRMSLVAKKGEAKE